MGNEKREGHLPYFGVGPFYSITIILLTAVSIVCSRTVSSLRFGQLSIVAVPFIIIGSLLVCTGGILVFLAIAVSRVHKGIEENRLITTGVYSYVRNPIYSGFLLMCTGAIFINANVALLVLPVAYWAFLTILLKTTEERWLSEHFGDEYEAYATKVNRCIPWFPESSDVKQYQYRRTIALVFAGLMVSLVLIFVFTRSITSVSAHMTYEATLAVKQNMLKENVENMVAFMDLCIDEYINEHPGVTEDDINAYAEELARKKIYSETHVDGTYMWVQKVLNYDGGDAYAIRLIHPNLSDTEGSLLSTNTVNEMGMKAYEEELEGVKKEGGVFLTYAFKKLNKDDVTKKVTYSMLYKRLDWIVCMGVNIDDLNHYQEQAKENMGIHQTIVMLATVATWMGLMLIMLLAYRRTKLRIYEEKNNELSKKLNRDILTGAKSRAYGEKLLERALDEYRSGTEGTLIAMMDVDNFKHFNDTYGHDIGDKVLIAFVEAVKAVLSHGDVIIRWGGDEFIVIIRDVAKEKLQDTGDMLRDVIRNIEMDEIPEEHPITTSVGLSYFEEDDKDITGVLGRADEALYRVKEAGRDGWNIKD